MTEIAAVIIQNENGDVLMWRRSPYKDGALLWQFPIGRVEAGETLKACITRACETNLGIGIAVDQVYSEVTCVYKHRVLHGTVFKGTLTRNDMRWKELDFREVVDARWISLKDIDEHRFTGPSMEVMFKMIREAKYTPG